MAIQGVDTKCYILALFVRDDGERFLLGSGHYEFKDTQMHFAANAIQNDIVEVQGNDGFLLAGQVRRPGTQSFDGYVGDGTMSKEETESYRRQFFSFFRKNFFYKVIYVFSDGTAIQRKSGFLVDDPTVQELYQMYPEYHVALNFEDVNYYSYSEDEEGQEQYAKEATIDTSSMRATGGLVWDNLGVVWEATQWGGEQTASGTEMTIQNDMSVMSRVDDIRLDGDTEQQMYSGKNLWNAVIEVSGWSASGGSLANTARARSRTKVAVQPNTEYTLSMVPRDAGKTINMTVQGWAADNAFIIQITGPDWVSVPVTFTTPANCTQITISGRYSDNTSFGTLYSETDEFQNIQLETGSQATSYEPYVGGIPAPNPDYPQDVQTVTGEQTVTVTGKNLFNPVAMVANTSYRLESDGAISTGAAYTVEGRRYFNSIALKAGTYTLSFIPTTEAPQGLRYSIRDIDTATDIVNVNRNFVNGERQAYTFTLTQDYQNIGICLVMASRTEAGQRMYLYDIQLEPGSATAYEPYQGQSYIIDLRGKNLLNISDFAMGGLFNGNPTSSNYRIQNANHPIAVQPNTTYTLSAQLASPVQGFRVGIHEIGRDGVFLRDLGWQQLGTRAFTMTTNSDTYYLKMVGSLSTTSTNVTTGGTENTTSYSTVAEFMRGCTLQFELGNTATAYAPYSPIELCKIGDYQDYIYKSGDDWYVHKACGKQIVDTASITLRDTYSNVEYATFGKPTDYGGYGAFGYSYPIVCTHAIHSSNPGSWDSASNIGHLYSVAETVRLWIGFAKGTGLDAIKTKLTGCINYYALGTPTDTQITDATLVGQLNALGAMKLFIGENNLAVQATGTNLPAPLSFKYYTTVAMTGAEWEEGGSGGATVVEVDSITNTYPIWRIKGPAVNPQLSVINTNTTIRYTGTVTSTQTLEIDMFNKTAKLNGVSVIGNVSGDWVSLAPRTNRVIYTAENADAQPSTIEWQEVVG